MQFDYKIKEEFNVCVIAMRGDLVDRSQASAMISEFDALIAQKQLKYVFDLRDLKYMNSTGLNVLINLFTKTRKEGGEVIIANVNKKINELLIITKLTSLFNITDSVERAIAKLK
jgi:anti-anti-sigma factor